MDVRQVVAGILEGSDGYRIDKVTQLLENGGVRTGEDLKYFDWRSLEELGGLSKMEINKIMRYVQENFPKEYEEHKKKRNEERKLQNETDILECKADHEMKLQREKMKFEEVKEAQLKKQREMEEEFRRNLQGQRDEPQKTNHSPGIFSGIINSVNSQSSFNGIFNFPFGNKDLEGEIANVLKNSGHSRVEQITSALKKDGLKVVDELRFYDWRSLEALGELSTTEINKIMEFVREEHPQVYERHKRRRDFETQNKKKLLEYKDIVRDMLEQLKTNEKSNFEEVISIIFDDCSTEPRNKKIKEILFENGVKRADDLKYFDWRSLEDLGGLTSAEISRIMDFVKENFNKDYKRHEKRRDEEMRICEELSTSKAKVEAFEQDEIRPDEKTIFDETISKIFDGCSTEPRIHKVKEILFENGVKRADDLKYFDWRSLEGLGGLTSAEIDRIMDFVKENFIKYYKRHEKRRDEEKIIREELSSYKDEESKQQEALKLGNDKGGEEQSIDCNPLNAEQKDINLPEVALKPLENSESELKQNKWMNREDPQTQEKCAGYQKFTTNDKCEYHGSNMNTSNDQSQESEDIHSQKGQPISQAIDKKEKPENSTNNDEVQKEDGLYWLLMHSSSV